MTLATGTRFGGHEIVAPLGQGGMGEVYRARDTRLNRDVALKILPADFALDPERLARFKREAQVLASLNHPNIGAIYGLEDGDGPPALVLELVEGATLADRIAQGPIACEDALPIARQIADALEAAHEQGMPTPATTLGNGEVLHVRPAFLPDGRHFIYRATGPGAAGGATFIGSLDSTERQMLFSEAAGNILYARGHVLFVRESTLMAQPFDASRRALTGDPFPVADQVQTNGNATPVGSFSASDNGVLVYQTSTSAEFGSQLTWFDRSGNRTGVVGNRRGYGDVELSPDGKQASISIAGARERRDIWLFDIARGAPTKFTFDEGGAQASVWSPDGSRIVFNVNRTGRWDLFQKASRGGVEEPLLTDMLSKVPESWSPDGRFIAYAATAAVTTASDLWILPLIGDRKPFPLVQTPFVETQGRFSPDGRWMAFTSNKSGQTQVYVVPFPNASAAETQISTSGGTEPRWRHDGKEIFYLNGSMLMAASVTAEGSGFHAGVPQRLFDFPTTGSPRSNYAVAPDGQRFLFNTRGDDAPATPITVVVNWDSK